MLWFINKKYKRIDDKELCPCGSELYYKDCCKNRSPRINSSRKPPEVQIMEKMRSSMKKCCLHPDQANCRGRIKEAHALQNNKIISLLARTERHVYMLDTKRQHLLIQLENGETVPFVEVARVSANDATTETCFCDYHDNVVFAAIEKGAPLFDDNNSEMKFVYAYKAFIFEYYKQRMSMDIFRGCFKDNPEAFTQPDMIQMYRMHQLKMKEFESVKHHYDSQIMAGTHDGVYTCSVKLPEQIKFADFAFIAPDYDLNGRKIRHTKKEIMHRLSITVFPEENQSWILFSCLECEKGLYEKFFSQVKEASLDKLKFYLNITLPLYSENMVLSGALWNSWNEDVKKAYTYYVNLQGIEAMKMNIALSFGLRNAARDKTDKSYCNPPKINLFG